ncbi:hypothetical protein SAMN05421811_103169 [Nonomuraea wenchangensis]|uniref:Minor tail protein n=1 Tax=Nonomuraea wenchangensis TaxID=568860 RepID=A0A1I0ESW5_9ACTN|nr:hypothetical protein SAMN05421811_103169 [Nonomuraea wenchangensis]
MPAKVRSHATGAAFGDFIEVNRPSGVAAGDILIAVHFNTYGLSGTRGPSGWSGLASQNYPNILAVRIYRKTATASEPTSYEFEQDIEASGTVHILCITGADTSTSPQVAIEDIVAETAPTPEVPPAAASSIELRLASVYPYAGQTLTWTPPSGYSLRGVVQESDTLSSVAASRQINSSAPTGQKDFVFSPPDIRFGIGVSISIASVVTEPDTGPPPPAFTPGRGSALYRWVFTRWDGTYLDDLELSGVTFDKRIGQAGSFSATIPITSTKIRDRVKRVISPNPADLGVGPGVVTCVVLRDGVPWGEYWITSATVSRSGREAPSISLTGSTMDAYMTQVMIPEPLDFIGEDQIDIARSLIESMQGLDHANLRLLPAAGSSGVTRDITYAAHEGSYGQRLQELGQADNGFEWMVNIAAGVSGIERHWVWGSPTLGSSDVEHVFSDAPHGGDILSWSEEMDALRGGTYWRARGDSVSEDASTSGMPLVSEPVLAEAHLEAGWPRLDRTVTFPRESVEGTLDDYAAYWAANAPGALRVDSVTVALGQQPTFTPNSLGDKARIYLHNEWHPAQSRVRRIIGIGITPPSADNGKETAQLIFEGIEVPSGG